MAHSEWLAVLARFGLVRASFIPPQDLRELRLVARYRRKLNAMRASELNGLHKIPDDAGIKLGAVVSDNWFVAQMRAQSGLHALVINPIIYAEMSLSFSTLEALDDVVGALALELREIPRPALFLSAKTYAQYRRRGGSKLQALPDFFIGAMLPSRVGRC
jgi:hypothetical protein